MECPICLQVITNWAVQAYCGHYFCPTCIENWANADREIPEDDEIPETVLVNTDKCPTCREKLGQFTYVEMDTTQVKENIPNDILQIARREIVDQAREWLLNNELENIRDGIREDIRNEIRSEIQQQLRLEVEQELRDQIKAEIREATYEAVKEELKTEIRNDLQKEENLKQMKATIAHEIVNLQVCEVASQCDSDNVSTVSNSQFLNKNQEEFENWSFNEDTETIENLCEVVYENEKEDNSAHNANTSEIVQGTFMPENANYHCYYCGCPYDTRQAKNYHMETHNQPLSCPSCPRTFQSKRSLTKHQIQKHK